MSRKHSHIAAGVILSAGALLILLTYGWTNWFMSMESAETWVLFLGRFHPVTLHLSLIHI